jgi:hypothetical protein
MGAVATSEPPVARDEGYASELVAGRLFDPQGPTLEDSIVAAWDELTVAGRVKCPVCSGRMSRTGGCESCGSELA